jgi:hypothetical protein
MQSLALDYLMAAKQYDLLPVQKLNIRYGCKCSKTNLRNHWSGRADLKSTHTPTPRGIFLAHPLRGCIFIGGASWIGTSSGG